MTATGFLSSSGVPLGMDSAEFGELRDSSELLGDVSVLRQRMDDEGYLLLRGFMDREAVLAARREILLQFAIVGEIDSINYPVIDAIQSQESFIRNVNLVAFTESLRSGMAYLRVVEGPEIMGFFTRFLDGTPRGFDFRWPRFMRPGESTGVHSDWPYMCRGTENVWSAWIPLGDVTKLEGALMILEGSHKNEEMLRTYATLDADKDEIGWLSRDPVELRQRLGGRWLSTDFRAGDVLLFGRHLIHASLDNNSAEGKCRLSSDTRYQLVGDKLDERWNGDISNPHGGTPRVFLPGGRFGDNNENFSEEWKEVDDKGRLLVRA